LKRLSTGVLATLIAAFCGLNAVAAPSGASHGNIGNKAIVADMGSTNAAPPANFGSPPSGQVPILYNDHHVYSKPDLLKKGRVLSALVRGGTVLIPLRSMFEQMGATVSYNARTKQVTVSKPGAEIKLTVGKKTAMINGEERTLDVPPMIYNGSVLVPIRVVSETMNAYVQWVPEKRVVVVRYIPPTPPPAPPTPVPTPSAAPATPPPTPTPAPVVAPYQDRFVVGDYLISPKIYNEFSPGNAGLTHPFSYAVRGAAEFNLFNLPWMIEGDYRQFNYPHNQGVATPGNYTPANNSCANLGVSGDVGCVTGIGDTGSYFVPAFAASDYATDARLGLRVANPHIYIGVGYMARTNNYGYGRFNGVGFGIEKLPSLNKRFSIYGSLWDYPTVKTNYSNGSNFSGPVSYSILRYELGATYSFLKSPLFIDFGIQGDRGTVKLNAPSGFTENGPYVGLGIKF